MVSDLLQCLVSAPPAAANSKSTTSSKSTLDAIIAADRNPSTCSVGLVRACVDALRPCALRRPLSGGLTAATLRCTLSDILCQPDDRPAADVEPIVAHLNAAVLPLVPQVVYDGTDTAHLFTHEPAIGRCVADSPMYGWSDEPTTTTNGGDYGLLAPLAAALGYPTGSESALVQDVISLVTQLGGGDVFRDHPYRDALPPSSS